MYLMGYNLLMKKYLKDTTPFDAAEALVSEEAIDAYMDEVLSMNDPAMFADALGTIARVRGMSKVAKKAGLSRESLYKALSSEGNPEFGTILRVMNALGLKFSVTTTSTH